MCLFYVTNKFLSIQSSLAINTEVNTNNRDNVIAKTNCNGQHSIHIAIDLNIESSHFIIAYI